MKGMALKLYRPYGYTSSAVGFFIRWMLTGLIVCVFGAHASRGLTQRTVRLLEFGRVADAAGLADQPEPPLIVAYLTTGGELVPIARYDGSAWRNTWPEPIERGRPLPVRTVAGIPRAWLEQPVPLTWTVWSEATRKEQRVSVTGIDREGSCVEAITLSTSFHSDPSSNGLAFNRPTRVDAVVALEQHSRDQLRHDVASHFRTAFADRIPQPGNQPGAIAPRLLAVARTDMLTDDTVSVEAVLPDARLPVMFIEAQRRFDGIPSDTDDDALSYSGWFRRDRAGTLTPISASLTSFSTAEGKSPRYTPIGIVRLSVGSIWVMSEIDKESQHIVLFEVSERGARKLTSAHIDGC
jgi:hypothetical protein